MNVFFDLFYFFQYAVIAYVAAINLMYFFLMVLGFFALRKQHGRLTEGELDTLLASPLVPAVSVLAPAYNEAATIRESVRAMLGLRCPIHEVIVINDGSKDDTLQILIDEFRLYRSSRRPFGHLRTKPINAVYESRDPIRLVVVDKENGGKADSLNAGVDMARNPMVAAVDSDSLLEPNALLYVLKPFLSDDTTIATGGIVRVVNGCTVEQGRVTEVRLPDSLMARFQTIEYLRAFLGGRIAFSFMNSLLLISGAFGLFRRDAVIKAGGFLTSTVGEDMELVIRLHKIYRDKGDPYRIVFVPDPVCWTEVPESLKILQRQRNRWQRGTVESISLHRQMLLRPRYGAIGIFGMPYFAAFEMFGPAVELLGYLFTFAGLIFGLINIEVAALFFVVSIGFGIVLSLSAVLLEEFTVRRYPSAADVRRLFFTAIIENLGFRQLLTLWRAKGLVDGLRKKQGWGAMERRGFQTRN